MPLNNQKSSTPPFFVLSLGLSACVFGVLVGGLGGGGGAGVVVVVGRGGCCCHVSDRY